MLKLDHVVFLAWEPEASLTFYAQTLGLPLAQAITGDDWGGRPWLMMVFALAEGRELVLVSLRGARRPPADDLPPDARHYAFAVDTGGEQQAWREKLAAAGVGYWSEDHGDRTSVYFEDPNGVVIEITTPASDAPPATDARALERARAWIAETAVLTG